MAIRLTVDAFSGRPNASWLIDPRRIGAELEVIRSRDLAGPAWPVDPLPLGFRGVILEEADEKGADLANAIGQGAVRIATPGASRSEAFDVARQLLLAAPAVDAVADAQLRPVLQAWIDDARSWAPPVRTVADDGGADGGEADVSAEDAQCRYQMTRYVPSKWNQPYVMPRNNCYNYGTNRITNSFAQPGRATGKQYTALACAAVQLAASSDGAKPRSQCVPPAGQPAMMMALVVAPGVDYHWYRKHQGFWAHKPGGTAVRNVDQNGARIDDPASCARGPYTNFCGYYYGPKTMRVS
jgi:hypothetical protein